MATDPISGGEAIIRCLENEGVEYIFGYSGGAVIPIFDAMVTTNTRIQFVLTRHEQGATHMADGYARATGKPAVVLVTSGPGATNTLTGIMTAHMDSVPMIVLTGQSVTPMIGKDAFQEADIFDITMPVVKHSYLVKESNQLPRILRESFHIATTGRPGPVLIDVPKDVSAGDCTADLHAPMDLPGYRPDTPEYEPADVQEMAEMLSKSRRPLILAGHGAVMSRAEKEIRRLAEKIKAPVTTTLLGKGAFPESHPLSLGMLGMHGTAYANKAVCECDLILNIGSRFDDRILGNPAQFAKQARILHIDIDRAEVYKMIRPDLYCVGDAREVTAELAKHVPELDTGDWIERLAKYRRKYPLRYRKQGGLKMAHIIDELYKMTEGRAVVATDVGQHQMWAAQFYRSDDPHNFLTSGGAGTMGFGLPAAIGAQFGRPDDLTVAIVGDGGFQMTCYELATARLHNLPLKIIVMNNHYLGMVRQWQELFYEDRTSGVDLEGNPDFVKLASAFGVKGFNLRRSGDVRKVLGRMLEWNDGPCLINAEVEKTDNVFPMVPAGKALEDMMIDPPRKGQKLDKPTGST
ncbi:biosynthetic-type acetolactate synthase large subunit [Kiritimatiella glycovorans]|uniref:Acetolactate synthase n=1 Tax=Kiritimatiella glycovorans TaxID=1307763 RepID=A0A0G3EHX8_9BACT|nr:biosynthetic-type acetolactate synthase large subunit [Kiritimatiella glycovorans]AKJ64410.1 Acetolactate synthase large subunit [Kiritimatiella glycovorans]